MLKSIEFNQPLLHLLCIAPGIRFRAFLIEYQLLVFIALVIQHYSSSLIKCIVRVQKMAPPAYLCDVCGKFFSSKFNVDTHRRNVHSTEERSTFTCQLCNKAFNRKSSLKRHVGEKHTNRSFSCSISGPRKKKSFLGT